MFKSGFVTIIGKANVGKSTLLNALVGERVAIVSYRPQTTRDKIIGIMNGEDYQVVFVDTPGMHKAKNQLSNYMMKNVKSALEGVNAVVYVINGEKKLDEYDMSIINQYASSSLPFVVAINKMDVADREKVVDMINSLKDIEGIDTIVPISAMKNKNLEPLKEAIVKNLPEGEQYYPEDMITDRSLRFMVSEIIREKAMRFLGDEVPYGIAVAINSFKERDDGVVEIDADIVCEKKAHKPIIIGKGGSMLKKIGTKSRLDIENLIDSKCFLTLYVKVKEEWRDSDFIMNELGYNIKDI